MKSLLRLFNAVLVDEKKKHRTLKDVLKRTVKNGYILDPYIKPTDELLDEIESVVLSGEKANASFHKSWKVVRDSSDEDLVLQQIVHYITTYGFERLGIYNQDLVYIPAEELKVPKVKDNMPLIVIRAMTSDEILSKIVELGSGIALARETLNDIMAVVESLKFPSDFVGNIKNRELKALLNDLYKIVPTDPIEFLRYLISKLTNESLVIKNSYLIAKIKESNGKFLDELIEKAPADLASIFLRYKPLFLAMKSISRNKTFFNHLRKQADKMHKPLAPDYLNSVTSSIKHDTLNVAELGERLGNASIYRKVRLARALKYRLGDADSIVYLIRNGRGYAMDFDCVSSETMENALDVVLQSIADSMDVNGKTIYIPDNVHYALPASEKQFVGNMPLGSYVLVPKDLIVGIHWMNTDRRIDLDLSIIGESGKIGWDWDYRSEDRKILFSGDMTDAPKPKGASELFYIAKGLSEPKIIFANYYNFDKDDLVQCKLFVAEEKPKKLEMDYMVDPNNIVATADLTISKKQNILGLAISIDGENRVYFANTSVGNSITSGSNEQSTQARRWLVNSLVNGIELQTVLKMAGAKVVSVKPKKDFIDLSPNALDKTTIIKLLTV